MVVSWARAISSISKKAWTFPERPYYYILYFQKLIESPTTVRQKEERDIPGPQDTLEGKSCLAGSSLIPWPCHGLGASRWLPTPVHNQLLESTQAHVQWVSDAIQSSHPLLPPSSLAFSLSQHQGLSQGVCASHLVAKVSELQLQCQSFWWIFRVDFL